MRRAILLLMLASIISLITASTAVTETERFTARLTGGQEVPPVATAARGSASFTKVSDTRMTYTLVANNIDRVIMGHIHLAPRGVNGQIIVDLRIPARCTVEATSIRCRGVITAAQLTGPFAGRTINQLAAAMRNGRTYANVHTRDFPGGEVRGQIQPAPTQ